MGPQVKNGSTCVKSSVQLWLVEVAGSSVLVSKSSVRLRVLSPENELLGIAPTIWVKVALEKSAANEIETNIRLVPLAELRDTCKLKLESGSVLEEIEAKAPSLVNLRCWVWAASPADNKATTAIATSCFMGLLLCGSYRESFVGTNGVLLWEPGFSHLPA